MSVDFELKEKNSIELKRPKKYKVVMYNDDFTPMDFVVEILMNIFHKNHDDAVNIMMNIHHGTKAVIGIYSYDIAVTKSKQAVSLARENGYPFQVEAEEA